MYCILFLWNTILIVILSKENKNLFFLDKITINIVFHKNSILIAI